MKTKKRKKTQGCPICGAKSKKVPYVFESDALDAVTKKPIKVKTFKFVCTNKKCGNSWRSSDEIERVDGIILRSAWKVLNSDQWKIVREALGLSTKTLTSRFLGLNDKAFSKYENGYSEHNLSIDLLVRLAIYSKENFEFIKSLHKKNFKFDTMDYQLACEKTGENWLYAHTKGAFNIGYVAVEMKPTELTQEEKSIPSDSFLLNNRGAYHEYH